MDASKIIVKAYCDRKLVHDGTLQEFYDINVDDAEYVEGLCQGLETMSAVEFSEMSGYWRVEKVRTEE